MGLNRQVQIYDSVGYIKRSDCLSLGVPQRHKEFHGYFARAGLIQSNGQQIYILISLH